MFEKSSYAQTKLILKKGLDTAVLRHQIYSNNLSNINTPGFKRDDVIFESELKRAIDGPKPIPAKRTNKKHLKFKGEISLEDVKSGVFLEKDTFSRNDENNVDLNEESANITKNEIMYNGLIALNKSLGQSVRTVIKKGGN